MATAAAQTGTNVSTAVANAFLQNMNQNTPEGSLRFDPTGNYGWRDPSTGHTYNIPTFTSTQTLSPQGQALKAQNDATKFNLATMGNQQSQRVGNLLGRRSIQALAVRRRAMSTVLLAFHRRRPRTTSVATLRAVMARAISAKTGSGLKKA